MSSFRKPLHIGLIVNQFPAYSETFFINQVKGLCERGHEVIVFRSSKHPDKVLDKIYQLDKYSNLRFVTIDYNQKIISLLKATFKNPVSFIQSSDFRKGKFRQKLFSQSTLATFNKYQCDVYHFGYSAIALRFLPVIKKLSGKSMISCYGSAEILKPLVEKGRVEKLLVLFNRIDSIHCISNAIAETIKQYGAPTEKIFINQSAIEPNFFSRRKEYFDNKRIQILSIGRLTFQKGFLIGLLTIRDLKNLFPDFIWKIVGDGRDREEILFHIHTLGLQNHVQLLGKKTKDEVYDLYDQSDIFFLPSVYEGLANVALEAMSMKLPIVSSLNGGMNEAITHDIDGMLSPNYDHSIMTTQLLDLCLNFEKRKKLGENARKTVEEKFSVGRYIDVFEEEYYKLISAK